MAPSWFMVMEKSLHSVLDTRSTVRILSAFGFLLGHTPVSPELPEG